MTAPTRCAGYFPLDRQAVAFLGVLAQAGERISRSIYGARPTVGGWKPRVTHRA